MSDIRRDPFGLKSVVSSHRPATTRESRSGAVVGLGASAMSGFLAGLVIQGELLLVVAGIVLTTTSVGIGWLVSSFLR
jgi:hypothetical protein